MIRFIQVLVEFIDLYEKLILNFNYYKEYRLFFPQV